MRTRPINLIAVMAVVATLFLGACGASGDTEAGTTTTADGATTTPGNDGDDKETSTTKGDDGTTEPADVGDPADVSSEARPYVDAMAASVRDDDDGLPLTDDQTECLSSRFIDTIGVDRLKAAGVTPETLADPEKSMEFKTLDLSEKEANKLYDHFGDCGIDLQAEMMKGMSEDGDLTPAAKACFESALSDENLRALMVTMMIKGEDAAQDDPAMGPVMGALMGCAFMGMDEGNLGSDASTTVPG